MMPNKMPTDYRQRHRREEKTLLLLVIGVLVGGGTGLSGLIWGLQQALRDGLCLSTGAALMTGLWLLLRLLEKWTGEE
jgi:hypothetical protein